MIYFPKALVALAVPPLCRQNLPIRSTTATAVRVSGAAEVETDVEVAEVEA